MAQWHGEIITTWISDAEGNRPDFSHACNWQDATGTPAQNIQPEPNAVVLYFFYASDAVMTAIAADSALSVLWNDVMPTEVI